MAGGKFVLEREAVNQIGILKNKENSFYGKQKI